MLTWFDVAYAILNIFTIAYCLKNYFSKRKSVFKLIALGFMCLTISNFVWAFALLPSLNAVLFIYSYLQLGLYAAFILLVLGALQLSDSNP